MYRRPRNDFILFFLFNPALDGILLDGCGLFYNFIHFNRNRTSPSLTTRSKGQKVKVNLLSNLRALKAQPIYRVDPIVKLEVKQFASTWFCCLTHFQ